MRLWRTKRSRITVVYKSGATVDLKCEEFVVKKHGGDITTIEWTNAQPRPLHIGVDEVAAVWQR